MIKNFICMKDKEEKGKEVEVDVKTMDSPIEPPADGLG